MKEAQSLLTEIAQLFLAELGDEAVCGKFTICMIDGHAELKADSYDQQHQRKSFVTRTYFVDLFKEVRPAMYKSAPERGAWYVATLNVNKKGEFSFDFDYDDRSEFSIQPSEEEFEDDLRLFPRG